MAAMFITLLAVTTFFTLLCSGANPTYPELNPALGKYQNAFPCLPLKETWYSLYRNYETDPLFGGTAKCGRFDIPHPAVNGTYQMSAQYGEISEQVLLTLSSSEGYDAGNVIHFSKTGQDASAVVYIAYDNCEECVVFRNTYINEEACVVFVSESALRKKKTCCDFVFDLLCGTGEKYYTYDESCKH
ncbi:unnamed protein product [Ixodes persulcatus]